MKIFVDTGAFIALMDESDQYHETAVNFASKELGKYHQVSSNFVVCETLNFLRTRVSYLSSIKFGNKIRENKGITIYHIGQELEEGAWLIFKKYADNGYLINVII